MDLDPAPGLSSLIWRMQKKIFFSYFFLITWPQTHHLQSKKFNFLLSFCVKILFCRHYFNTFMRKGKDPDPGGPKTCWSGSGSRSGSQRLVCVKFTITIFLWNSHVSSDQWQRNFNWGLKVELNKEEKPTYKIFWHVQFNTVPWLVMT